MYEENMEFSEKGRQKTRKPLLKIFYKHPAYLFHVDIPKFQMLVNPVIAVKFGYDTDKKVVDLNLKMLEAQKLEEM